MTSCLYIPRFRFPSSVVTGKAAIPLKWPGAHIRQTPLSCWRTIAIAGSTSNPTDFRSNCLHDARHASEQSRVVRVLV
jgi:hypothetical protein